MNLPCHSPQHASEFAERVSCISDSTLNRIPRSFAQTLTYHIKQSGLTNESLEALTGITVRSLSRYRNGKSRPSLQDLTLICLALHLEPDYSEDLVFQAGYTWRTGNEKDIACHILLREFYKYSLDSIDEHLRIANIKRTKSYV